MVVKLWFMSQFYIETEYNTAYFGTLVCPFITKWNILCFDIKLTHKWQFYDHFRRFLCKCMFIFHKTEVQTVILICLMGLNSDWFKNYDTKCKYFHFLCLLHTSKKWRFAFFAFLHFSSYLWNQLRFRLVKHLKMTVWISVLWKITIYLAKNGQIWSENSHLSVVTFFEFTEHLHAL